MALNVIKGMKLNDGTTEFDVAALSNEALKKIYLVDTDLTPPAPNPAVTNKNNLVIGSNTASTAATAEIDKTYGLKNTDIKAYKSVRIWPGIDGSSAGEVDFMGDGAYNAGLPLSDIKQIHLKALISKEIAGTSKNKTIRFKQTCSELELNNKNCTGTNEETEAAGKFDIKVKHDNDFQGCNIKARSLDLRAISKTNPGTGGGIAVQIASCDGSLKENKFKIETDRKKDVSAGLCPDTGSYSQYYNSEGGTGIEIGTINSQFESLGTKEIRRLANADVFAVTRSEVKMYDSSGEITTDPSAAKKWDYVTQADDSKDIKSSDQCAIKFIDLVNAATYLKAKKLIPSDGSFIPAVNVGYNLTSVTAASAPTVALKSEQYSQVLAAEAGLTINATVTVSGSDVTSECWNAGTNTVTIAAASLSGDVVITASAS